MRKKKRPLFLPPEWWQKLEAEAQKQEKKWHEVVKDLIRPLIVGGEK